MSKSIYLINPRADFPSYYGMEVAAASGVKGTVLMADLTITSVAGLLPDDFDVLMCDENLSPIRFDADVDFVAITGKVGQNRRMASVAQEFRRRGITVIIGGPFASLSPESMRPHCDILVRGEIEQIAPELWSDLRDGSWDAEYIGDRPDLAACRLPRWEGYPNDDALMGSVQTSRGCPFECEYCDVIQYLGRRQRHKAVAQVLAELDRAYQQGYRDVFLADDNFTVHRSRAKELLTALRHWNLQQTGGRVRFFSQVSIDAAKDEELLRMCAEAGLTGVFIGIETPNAESLKEARKHQNLHVDLRAQVERFLHYGIVVSAGMIVGFDADGPDVFERQYEFAMLSAVPVFTLVPLVAPEATPLYARIKKEGRLMAQGSYAAGTLLSTNISPLRMSSVQLFSGMKKLCNDLYAPDAFAERVIRFVDVLGKRRDPRSSDTRPAPFRAVHHRGMELLDRLLGRGADETRMWRNVRSAMLRKPEAREFVLPLVVQYAQIRYMYEQQGVWEPRLGF